MLHCVFGKFARYCLHLSLLSIFASPVFPAPNLELSATNDDRLSPFTGYTREHWLEITERLILGILPYFDSEWQELFGDRVRTTSEQFQESFLYLFGRDGGPIPWGRSLTYRFASISALGYALLNNTSNLEPGQSRRLASGCLKYFWEKGSLSENGLLEPGFHGPNSVVAESYIRRGGPYWAAHGLIPLVLPGEHPFWSETEKPIPADREGGRLALAGPEMAVKPTVVYINGTRHRTPKEPGIEIQADPGLLRIQFEGVKYQIQLPR